MEEGERLSKKQLTQENTIKKLRAELTELRSEKVSTSASLLAERQKVTLPSAHMDATSDLSVVSLVHCRTSCMLQHHSRNTVVACVWFW